MSNFVRLAFAVLLSIPICSVLALMARSQEKPTRSAPSSFAAKDAGKASPVTLLRCRIKLIDDVTLASGRTGVLANVKPREGDAVKKDEPVANLIDDVPRAALAIAEKEASNDVEVRYSLKARELAAAEHEAALIANRNLAKTVPDIEVKKLKLGEERGVLQVEKAQHDFETVKLKRDEARGILKTFRIDAPFDGVVTRVFKSSGEAVREGDPILELTNTSRVRVEGYVNIKDVWNIAPGCPVTVQLDIPDVDLPVEQLTFEGRVAFVDVKVEPVTREVRVWAEVANRNNVLRTGLTARMTIDPSASVAAPPVLGLKADDRRSNAKD